MYMCNLESKNDELIIPNVRRIFDYDSRIMTARNLLSKGTQTDYRDSETQTVPWEPPYKLATGILKIYNYKHKLLLSILNNIK